MSWTGDWFLLSFAVATAMILAGGSASAHVSMHDPPLPSHFTIDNQEFDATVGGLRAYLTTVETRNLPLYSQLAPDVERLETRRFEAGLAAGAGLVAGTASLVYAFAGRTTCVLPPVTDPEFAADSDAWGRCNQRNMDHVTTFTLLGTGALVLGLAAAWAIAPSRADILEIVNKHNRLSPTPLELRLGYDPTTGAGYGGAVLTF